MSNTPISSIWRLVRIEKRNIRYLFIYAILAGAMSLTIPLGIQTIVGIVMTGKLSSSWYILVIGISILVAFSGITRLAQITILDTLQRKLFVRYAINFSEQLSEFRESNDSISLEKKSTRFLDIVTLQKSFSKLVFDFSGQMLQILSGITLLSIYHPNFLILGFFIVIIVYFGLQFTWKSGFESAGSESAYKFETSDTIRDMAVGELTEGRMQKLTQQLINNIDGYVYYRNKHFSILRKQIFFAVAAKVVLTATMLIIGSSLLINQEITLGQFLAAEILIITLLDGVEKLILTVEYVYDSGIAIEKLECISKLKEGGKTHE